MRNPTKQKRKIQKQQWKQAWAIWPHVAICEAFLGGILCHSVAICYQTIGWPRNPNVLQAFAFRDLHIFLLFGTCGKIPTCMWSLFLMNGN
jgi:hypothetical protein